MAKATGRAGIAVFIAGGLVSLTLAAASAQDFDQGVEAGPILEKARAEAEAIENIEAAVRTPEEDAKPAVWVIMDRAEAKVARTDLGLSRGPVITNGMGSGLFSVTEADLPRISSLMHEKYGRCGGFFSYDSKEEALKDLNARPMAVPTLEYEIDQQGLVIPMVAKVSEKSIRGTISKLAAFHNRYYSAQTGVQSSAWIASNWESIAQGRSDISVEFYDHRSWAQDSVILTIKGTREPEKVIVMGGHADSIAGMWGGSRARAPGADDNASGIAVLTEALRIIVESGYRPSKTVKLMAYAAEEVGLKGSKEIAGDYKRRGVAVEGVVQFDMTNFAGSAESILLLSDYTNAAQNTFMGKLIDEYVKVTWGWTACGYACSDHASWTKNGFAASTPFEAKKGEYNRNIHSDRDTLANSGGNAKHSVPFAKLAVAYMVEMAK